MTDADPTGGSIEPLPVAPQVVGERIPSAGLEGVGDLNDPVSAMRAVGETSLRLLAGAVPKAKLDHLQRLVAQSPDAFPWQVLTREMMAEPVDPQRLMQQALVAQRDWIARGGRLAKGPGVVRRAKGVLARLMAQLVFGVIFLVVVVAGLVLLQKKVEWANIYEIVPWVQSMFGG